MNVSDQNTFLWLPVVLLPAAFLLLLLLRRASSKRLPPGPPGWPIFGNLFDLSTSPPIALAQLKQKYGPIIWLKLGAKNTMVILTREVATELFKNHDLVFADRTITDTMRSHDHHKSSLALAPYGPWMLMLRRLCTVELFMNKRINESTNIRQKCVKVLVKWIEKESISSDSAGGIHMARLLFLASFNTLGNLIFSRDLVAPESEKWSEFFMAMSKMTDMSGQPNVSDIFPWLRRFDLQRMRKNMDREKGIALRIVAGFVKERLEERQRQGDGAGEKRKDFLDVLLDFEGKGKDEPEKLREQDINLFILELFMAGSETTSSTIEWALTELLRDPEQMKKVKAELTMVVGKHRNLEETDIDNLSYLQAIIKETLRLHPPVPFLVPRKASQDTDFLGYNIPKGTQVLVNVWAIGRDPECWDDPLSFKPERFVDSKVDYKTGKYYELIPFGSGRRICPGVPLAQRMLPLLLGTLLHEFHWEFGGNLNGKSNIDMTEKFGLSLKKLEPLKAIPTRLV